MRNASGAFPVAEGVSKKGLLSFIPIAVVLLLVVIFHLELHYALLLVIIALFIFYRFNARDVIRVLKHGLSMDVIVLIIGIMLFKETMEASGAVKNLSGFLTSKGIPFTPILFLLPFATGLLTGITVGFVGSTFPLIMSIAGGPSIGVISFAFASGFFRRPAFSCPHLPCAHKGIFQGRHVGGVQEDNTRREHCFFSCCCGVSDFKIGLPSSPPGLRRKSGVVMQPVHSRSPRSGWI